MRRFRVLVATAVMATTSLHVIGFATPAAASCASPLTVSSAVEQADVVVVGTVTSARSRNRIATIAVDEVWKGDVGSTIEVFGGPSADNTATTVDRTYAVGVRYLLVAYEPAAHGSPMVFGGRYEDNSCSVTQPWTDALAAFRPATARVLAPTTTGPTTAPTVTGATTPASSDSATSVWIAATGAALLIAVTALWWLRRRRHAGVPADVIDARSG